MDEKRKEHVDPVTENAMLRLEKSILKKIGDSIDTAIKEFTNNFSRVYDMQIKSLNDDITELKTEITNLKIDIKKSTRFYIVTIISVICMGSGLLAIFL